MFCCCCCWYSSFIPRACACVFVWVFLFLMSFILWLSCVVSSTSVSNFPRHLPLSPFRLRLSLSLSIFLEMHVFQYSSLHQMRSRRVHAPYRTYSRKADKARIEDKQEKNGTKYIHIMFLICWVHFSSMYNIHSSKSHIKHQMHLTIYVWNCFRYG